MAQDKAPFEHYIRSIEYHGVLDFLDRFQAWKSA